MRMVIIESPYAPPEGEPAHIQLELLERNERFARACIAHALSIGEAPFASHMLYTQRGILRDGVPEERAKGIAAGLEIGKRADATVVYTNLGISRGMEQGIRAAEEAGRPIEWRVLESWR